MAQECQAPAVTAVKRPRGASAWPLGAFVQLVLLPQQVMVPSACRPQVWALPAATAVIRLLGALS